MGRSVCLRVSFLSQLLYILASSVTIMVDGGATPAAAIVFPPGVYTALAKSSPYAALVLRYP